METHRPLVCILTDGSGNGSTGRTDYSIALIEGTGACVGPVMGDVSDRAWYSALLAGDDRPFLAAAETIAGAIDPGCLVVADPVEGYNPMHDLCAAMADRVAALVGGTRATYPLTRSAAGGETRILGCETVARKSAALAAYAPLQHEIAALLQIDPDALVSEQILMQAYGWPEDPDAVPDYERIGQERAASGTYARHITYRDHVRPMAMRLTAS